MFMKFKLFIFANLQIHVTDSKGRWFTWLSLDCKGSNDIWTQSM